MHRTQVGQDLMQQAQALAHAVGTERALWYDALGFGLNLGMLNGEPMH